MTNPWYATSVEGRLLADAGPPRSTLVFRKNGEQNRSRGAITLAYRLLNRFAFQPQSLPLKRTEQTPEIVVEAINGHRIASQWRMNWIKPLEK